MSGLYLFLQLGFVHSEKRFVVERFNYLFPGESQLNSVADLFFCRFREHLRPGSGFFPDFNNPET
jgi:hypothetical protein